MPYCNKMSCLLGGDYKFLLMIMGLNSATADYSCLWCEIHWDSRWDTRPALIFYNTEPLRRTQDKIKKQCHCKSSNYGCINPPLINIDIDHIVADELHLLLRITYLSTFLVQNTSQSGHRMFTKVCNRGSYSAK